MLSIKMIDGSRYDTDQPLEMRNDNWITIQAMTRYGVYKRVRLNPKHMVSITEVQDDQLQEMAH